jgi:hypothetical protein
MGSISKSFSLLLIALLAVSSLIMAKPAFAQIPTPSVPEFTVKFVGTISAGLLTGTFLPCVNITIKNQPFTPYTDQNGNKINLYYLIRWKENSSNSWQQDELPLTESNSNYTILPLALVRSEAPPPSGQVDFQVEAVIGYVTYVQGSVPQGEYIPPTYTGEMSGWSNIQTIAIPENSTSITSALVVIAFLVVVLVSLLVYMRKRRSAFSQTKVTS